MTAATTIDLESTSVLDNNPNGGLKMTAGGDIVVNNSTVKAANSANVDATSTGGKICSRGNTVGGNVVSMTASGPVGSGDVTLVGTAVQVTNAHSGIKLTSTNGSVLAGGLAGCPPNSFTSTGNDGNMTVTANGVAFLGGACVDVAENVTVTAAGAGKDCSGDIIIDLTDAVVRNDFGKPGVIAMTACGGSGLIEINNAILADAGAKGGGDDPNAVSTLNGGKKTDPLAPPCSESPACGGPVNQPVSADRRTVTSITSSVCRGATRSVVELRFFGAAPGCRRGPFSLASGNREKAAPEPASFPCVGTRQPAAAVRTGRR